MALRQVVTVGPIVAGVANYLVTSVTPTSGQVLTLAHTTLATPRRVLATFGNEVGARTIALTGTNDQGVTIQETLVIPSGGASSTVYTEQDFASVTSAVTGGGAWSNAMTLGTNSIASSDWKLISDHITPINVGWNVVTSGTVNWTIEQTNDAIEATASNSTNGAPFGPLGPIPPIPTPFVLNAALQNQAGNATGFVAQPFHAWRLVVNSGAGSVTATAIEAGIIQGH